MLKSTHIMESVCKLNKDDSDILGHCKKHLTKVLSLHIKLFRSLTCIVRCKLQSSELGNSVNKKGYISSKTALYLFFCTYSIFNDIMKKPCCDGLFIHLKVSKDYGYAKRMNDIWFTRLAQLSLMGFSSMIVCLLNKGYIIRRVVFFYSGDKVMIKAFRALKLRDCFNFSVIEVLRHKAYFPS